jgi:hypothetical protein
MNIDPHQASQCIKNKNFLPAEQVIIDFISHNMQKDADMSYKIKLPQVKKINSEDALYQYCNLYANLISELFCAPSYRPSIAIRGIFLSNKMALDWLFSASMWKNTDSLIDHLKLIQVDKVGRIIPNFNKERITLVLMLIGLGSKYKLPWQLMFKMAPAFTLSTYIGLISNPIPALSSECDSGCNHLLKSAKDLPMFDLPVVEDLSKVHEGFFTCSYATSPDKYEFKKWVTRLLRHNLPQWLNQGVKKYIANIKPLKPKKKLKVAVMLERYSTNHAMHRCYHAMFEILAKKYELVAFCDEKKIENSSLDIFEKVIELKRVFSINENVELIAKEQPDIILYPSIGMKFWGVYLSQLRLAPLQIMLPGHPSSSFSPEIDYLFNLGNSTPSSELQPFINEKLIAAEHSFLNTSIHTQHDELTPKFIAEHDVFLKNDEEVRIGINGVITKVTYRIINICKQLQLQSSKKITFVFFSGYQPNQLAYLATKKQLSRDLKYFDLTCYSNYISYMKVIGECHFLLPTLPFGGSNSNVDAMVLKKPKLFMRGNSQIYTRTDQWEWERIELDNELGCNSENELIKKSLQLVEDSVYRHELYIKMTDKCKIENIFSTDNTETDFISPLLEKVIGEVTNNNEKSQK